MRLKDAEALALGLGVQAVAGLNAQASSPVPPSE